ncbi:MAG: DNA polymerase III subunit delta' [Lachnospiraceae bacterium]|nr:DNA polymerase III subunit delta' [Lachnospiraceae bacterium]
MNTFKDVIGREQVVEHLKNTIRLRKVSHAYIFHGEDGIGKNFVADIFAAALQCEEFESEPCGVCKSCLQAAGGNHPDIIHVLHEKATIGVDDIRTQLNNDIQVKPYSSRYKIYIIDEAEKMTEAAQNALLKTIEEPPEYAIIMLLSNNLDAFLSTILSRCVTLNMKTVPREKIQQYLMEYCGIPDYQAELSAAFSGGNLGKAIKYASSEEFVRRRDEVLHLVKHIEEMPMNEIMEYLKHLAEEKTMIGEYLDLLLLWYRDVLLFKATKDTGQIIYKEELLTIQKQAAGKSFETLNDIIEAFSTVRSRLKNNVNFEASVELLLLAMQRE